MRGFIRSLAYSVAVMAVVGLVGLAFGGVLTLVALAVAP